MYLLNISSVSAPVLSSEQDPGLLDSDSHREVDKELVTRKHRKWSDNEARIKITKQGRGMHRVMAFWDV